MRYAAAGPVALMRNLDLVCAFAWGTIFFNETPHWNSYLGACLIAGTTGGLGVYKWFKWH